MQDILPSNLRKNFSYLALLAMQHYRLAFQNSFSVWTTYEIDPYHVYVLLTHIVSEAFFRESMLPECDWKQNMAGCVAIWLMAPFDTGGEVQQRLDLIH